MVPKQPMGMATGLIVGIALGMFVQSLTPGSAAQALKPAQLPRMVTPTPLALPPHPAFVCRFAPWYDPDETDGLPALAAICWAFPEQSPRDCIDSSI